MQTLTKTTKRAGASPAESIINDAPRNIPDMPVGEVKAQGDLLFVSIATLPTGAKSRKNRQLAEGTTQGSRHVAETGKVFDASPTEVAKLIKKATGKDVQERYIGPVIVGPSNITHPEHGHHNYEGECVLAVVFQRVLDAEEREIRALD